jgi:hypothetical protein
VCTVNVKYDLRYLAIPCDIPRYEPRETCETTAIPSAISAISAKPARYHRESLAISPRYRAISPRNHTVCAVHTGYPRHRYRQRQRERERQRQRHEREEVARARRMGQGTAACPRGHATLSCARDSPHVHVSSLLGTALYECQERVLNTTYCASWILQPRVPLSLI